MNWIVLVFAMFALSANSFASSFIVPSDEVMAEQSDVIIDGTVKEIKIDGNKKTGFITYVTIQVREVVAGDLEKGSEIVVKRLGGFRDKDVQVIFGEAKYKVGQNVHLYLELGEDGYFVTKHMALGSYKVSRDPATGEMMAARDEESAEYFEIVNGKVKKHKSNLKNLRQLKALEKRRAKAQKRIAKSLLRKAPVTAQSEQETVEYHLAQGSAASNPYRLMEPGSRWFVDEVPVFGDTNGDKTLGDAASKRIVAEAAGAWSRQPNSSLVMTYKGEKQGPGWGCNDGFMTVSFNDPKEQVGDPQSCSAGALAVGGFCASGDAVNGTPFRKINSGAIVYNDGWNNCWFWNEQNLKEIATHEMGHAIGFAHSWDPNLGTTNDQFVIMATMYWMAHFDGRGAGLKEYDRGALSYLYPGSGSTQPTPTPTPIPPTPTPTPVPTPNPTPVPTPTPTPSQDKFEVTLLPLNAQYPLKKQIQVKAVVKMNNQLVNDKRHVFFVVSKPTRKGMKTVIQKRKTKSSGIAEMDLRPFQPGTYTIKALLKAADNNGSATLDESEVRSFEVK